MGDDLDLIPAILFHMADQQTYSLIGFPHRLLAMSQDVTRTYRYRDPGELVTLLQLLKMPKCVIEDFRAAQALGMVRVEINVVLTPEMLNWFE
jgi:hypothetical protein